MTTHTHALPDLDEALDFSPTCDAKGCDVAATWYGEMTCGCARHLGCDYHTEREQRILSMSDIRCLHCGNAGPGDELIVWRPL